MSPIHNEHFMHKPLRFLALLASLLPTLVLAAPTLMRLVESYASTDVINVGANTIGALSTAGGWQPAPRFVG
jgi:hypothetical protein